MAFSVLTNGVFTDKNLNGLQRFLAIMRDKAPDALVGACTNTPGLVLEKLADMSEVQIVMAPVIAQFTTCVWPNKCS